MSSKSVCGTKRPATTSEDDGAVAADPRPKQQPRLRLEIAGTADPNDPEIEVSCTDDIGGNIDLMCQVASFMNPGGALNNYCIAVGPVDAAEIRHDYLRDNDNYIVTSLRPLFWLNIRGWYDFAENLALFDKCRDNILAWMEINDDWKERCTAENTQRYKEELHNEANLVFNNAAVAMEIGLIDVVSFLVEKRGIDVNERLWVGFNALEHGTHDDLVRIALVRGNTLLLTYLLSTDGFDLKQVVDDNGNTKEAEIVIFASTNTFVHDNCFRLFVAHPKVNLNITDNEGTVTPLHRALLELAAERDDVSRNLLKSKVEMLLDAGADPHFEAPNGYVRTPIEYARRTLSEINPGDPSLREMIRKMEMWGFD